MTEDPTSTAGRAELLRLAAEVSLPWSGQRGCDKDGFPFTAAVDAGDDSAARAYHDDNAAYLIAAANAAPHLTRRVGELENEVARLREELETTWSTLTGGIDP